MFFEVSPRKILITCACFDRELTIKVAIIGLCEHSTSFASNTCKLFTRVLLVVWVHSKGKLPPNFTSWDEPTRDWSTCWKVVTQNSRKIGGRRTPLKDDASYAAQVCCDVVSFGTISIRYVKLVQQRLVYACRAVVSVVRCVYAFRNYGSLVRIQVWRDVTWHFNWPFGKLPSFEYRLVKKIFRSTSK